MALPQAFLGDRADIRVIDENAPGGDVVEAEQQPRQGGFAGAAGTDHRDFLTGMYGETDAMQDRPILLVGEGDVFKADFRRPDVEFPGAGPVGDLGFALEHGEHQLHVGQGVFELTVDDAEEIQRNEQLQQKGIDQHQIPQRHRAGHHAAGGQDHDQGDADGDDGGLAEIERRQGSLALDRRRLPAAQGIIVAPEFIGFIAEVLDGLVVQQAVDGLAAGLGVQRIHGDPVLHAPFRDFHGEHDIDNHRGDGDEREPDVIAEQQDAGDHENFHQRGQQVEHHVVEQRTDAARAPLDVARQATRLAFQVKAQGEFVQMLQCLERHAAGCAVAHPGKYRVAQFVEQGTCEFKYPVEDQQEERQHQ